MLIQFLMEALFLALTGGLIGILIGAGVATSLPMVVEFFSAGDQ